METPKDLVKRNVRKLREERKHTVRSLSARLGELGRPILPSGITKLEDGSRRVDVDDLVALSIALGVNPNRLLLPVEDTEDDVELTPAVAVRPWQAWAWAQGRSPLLAAQPPDEPAGDLWHLLDDFKRHSLPPTELRRGSHTAVKAAQDVLEQVTDMLDLQYEREKSLARRPGKDPDPKGMLPRRAAGLRRALARLVAEVDDVIGDVDGDR